MTAPGESALALEGAVARWEDEGGSVAVRGAVSLREEVLLQVRRWWDAWASKRVDTIASMTAEEYGEITEMRHWRQIGKAALLDAARRFFESSSIHHWNIYDPVVNTFENEEAFAVCTYRFTLSGTLRGVESDFEGFATDVLVKHRGTWKYFSHHNSYSAVAPPSVAQHSPSEDH